MEKVKTKRVGMVATGDEIVNGDIINTNTQHFAQQLKLNNIVPGKQITVVDDQDEIRDAILYLAQDHDCVITIGGLGPTKDDLTRNGLAEALKLPLEFNEEPWKWITDKFKQFNIPLTENNRQQAMLPKGSEAIHNPNGTACACHVEQDGKDYFMMPGPPNECFPIFDSVVIKKLLAKNYAHTVYRKSWMLFNPVESHVADALEKIDKNGCELGYRYSFPYLEIKLKAENKIDLDKVAPLFEEALKGYTMSHGQLKATEKLAEKLKTAKKKFIIDDQATGGRLESLLLTPETAINLSFPSRHPELVSGSHGASTAVKITGLKNYWKQKQSDAFELELTINGKTEKLKIPSRKDKTLLYACEIICLRLLNII